MTCPRWCVMQHEDGTEPHLSTDLAAAAVVNDGGASQLSMLLVDDNDGTGPFLRLEWAGPLCVDLYGNYLNEAADELLSFALTVHYAAARLELPEVFS